MFIWGSVFSVGRTSKKKKKKKKPFNSSFFFLCRSFSRLHCLFFVMSDADRARSESSTHSERPESADRSAEVGRRLERLEEMLAGFSQMADKGEKTKGKKKRKRAATESEESDLSESSAVDSESDSDDGWRTVKRKRKRRIALKEAKKAKKEEKRRQRLERARKRDWKNSSHREQFAAIDEALKPIQAAKDRARKEGASRQLRADLEEGEGALLRRAKLLLLADTKGWAAAKIYAGQVECGSDSEDERRMRAAALEAAKEAGQRRPFRPRRAVDDGQQPATQPAIGANQGKPTQGGGRDAPPARGFAIGPPDCWTCGERGHMQWNCPRRLGAGRMQDRAAPLAPGGR